MEKQYMYLGSAWYDNNQMSEEEKRTGKISQLRLMHYLFSDIILANTLGEKLAYDGCTSEIISPYNEETEEYEDEFQFFVVNLSLDEDFTKELIKKANTDIYLRYSEEYDIYIMSVGNLGTSRDYIMTDLYSTDDYELDCMKDFYGN